MIAILRMFMCLSGASGTLPFAAPVSVRRSYRLFRICERGFPLQPFRLAAKYRSRRRYREIYGTFTNFARHAFMNNQPPVQTRHTRRSVAVTTALVVALGIPGMLAASPPSPRDGGDVALDYPGGMPEEMEASVAWVDPVVTGPVSDDFRRRRAALGCDDAVWPDIPKACFPD
ncbi:MAG: hypothetical protein ABJG86_14150 [Nitratireductor sp.]